jgi:hypothetical protein
MDNAALASQVQKALVAHAAWKVRLAQAIDSGSSDFVPMIVQQDNVCDLGQWLYTGIADELKTGARYEAVRQLHRQFHLSAAAVLETALAGRQAEARAAMEADSEFARTSTNLTLELTAWRTSIEG